MPIYTRTGDSGTTGLYGGKRLLKSDLQVEAYGSIDELTSFIGLIKDKIKNKNNKLFFISLQKDLYQIMAFLSGAKLDLKFLEEKTLTFENKIDELEKKLPKLKRFILPGGTEISSWFQILRVICRRAERNVVRFNNNIIIVKYLNRLSDLLFVTARNYGKNKEIVL
ncbi:MAG: cob(I)yrinic acid a,c-diamide adenosyltransferase [Candidatus Roizmanbacteria bacterium]|nr:cob(I)yrinic acid a,c-diamide adenosyltransferase [Candidatus Roizmanbacteria bacterium]